MHSYGLVHIQYGPFSTFSCQNLNRDWEPGVGGFHAGHPMYGNLGGQVVNEREFTDDLTSHINLFKITYLLRLLTTTTLTLHDCSLAIHVFSNFCATCPGDSSQSTCEYGE